MFDKAKITKYIEDRYQSDGGYFFARVLPSGGADTYYAIRSLDMLGVNPQEPDGPIRFFSECESEGNLDDIRGLFFATQTYKTLRQPFSYTNKHIETINRVLTDSLVKHEVDIEVSSELESLYLAVIVAETAKVVFDKAAIGERIESVVGFGLATTYFALDIAEKLGYRNSEFDKKVLDYLLTEKDIESMFLEQIYWFINSMKILNKNIENRERLLNLLTNFQNYNGGFRRSKYIGISTLEDTFYALSILKQIDSI